MAAWHDLIAQQIRDGAVTVAGSQPPRIARYADLLPEYQALDTGLALVDRSDRALLRITGKDRVAWLHNLTTNQVKTLGAGEGNYAFVLNVQGRILFDVNVLVRADSIWIDLDRQFLDPAKTHFAKYTITEDVAVTDRADDFVRLALVGQTAAAVLSSLGAANAAAMAQLSQSSIEWASPLDKGGPRGGDRQSPIANRQSPITILRHDFCGPFAVELFVPADRAVEAWTTLVEEHRVIPVGQDAVQIRRIEAGIPWPGYEITSEYLPAETRQQDRAVSYQKGCYLGQEVVERMRSRQVVARQLVGLRLDSPSPLGRGARGEGQSPSPFKGEGRGEGQVQLLDPDGKPAGQVTSACHSPALECVVALGYVKTALATPGTRLTVGAVPATVVDLPFRP